MNLHLANLLAFRSLRGLGRGPLRLALGLRLRAGLIGLRPRLGPLRLELLARELLVLVNRDAELLRLALRIALGPLRLEFLARELLVLVNFLYFIS